MRDTVKLLPLGNHQKELKMRKQIFLIGVLATALTMSMGTYARGPGGQGNVLGQGRTSEMSDQYPGSAKYQTKKETRRSQMSDEQAQQEQERQRLRDGSGPMHENRTMTQEQNQVQTQNEAQIRQQTKVQVKPQGQSDEPLQLKEQIQEKSRQQLRIDKQ